MNDKVVTWSAREREDFFQAIARHRRAAWRVTLASGVALFAFGLIVATLMSPVFYAAAALVLDLANLVVHAPNLVEPIGNALGPMVDHPEMVSATQWIRAVSFAACPGLLLMIFVVVGLRRALRLCAVGDEGLLGARACNPQVLAEQRFHNVIEEMAVAASLAPPRVLIRDGAGMNAVVLGADDARTSILTTTGLLTELSRQEMLGVAGHLVGSIANGDVTIGLRTSIVLSLFGLCARFADAFSDPGALRDLGKLTLAMVAPSRARSRKLAAAVADPFASRPAVEIAGWRRLAWMPLAGPVAITGFFAGLASFFALGPLLALAWRQRKYMADATAVRLTRDPDAIGGAIHKLGRQGFALVPWASHLAFAHASASRSSVIGASIVPMFPASSRRLRSLQRLGAHIDRLPSGMARRFWLIVTPLYAVVGVLAAFAMFMLVILSVGLTMLFLGLPFGVIHTVLRLLGH